MADVYVNALTTISTEPTTTDSLVVVNRNTNEGKIIDYNKLADVILNKLTSKTYSGLNTTSKLLVGAINELDSDVSSLNSSLTDITAYVSDTDSLTDLNVSYEKTNQFIVRRYTNTADNRPTNNAGMLFTMWFSSTTAVQLAVAYNATTPLFHRRNNNGTWTEWLTIS